MTLDSLDRDKLYYCATPYSKYELGPVAAFIHASEVAGKLMKAGLKVFSPIAHGHPLSAYGGVDPLNHDIWISFDKALMDRCDALIVAQMASLERSYGIKCEIAEFVRSGKPVYFLDPKSMEVELASDEERSVFVKVG